jgi:hypothetical protein
VGTISYDDSAPGTYSNGHGFYRGTALNAAVDIWVDGLYEYVDDTPSTSDEIDLLPGTTTQFGFYKRGPVVATGFSPFGPFSHLDFDGGTITSDILSGLQLSGSGFHGGLGDTEAATSPYNDPYYYITANNTAIEPVPEPYTVSLLGVAAACFALFRWQRSKRAVC